MKLPAPSGLYLFPNARLFSSLFLLTIVQAFSCSSQEFGSSKHSLGRPFIELLLLLKCDIKFRISWAGAAGHLFHNNFTVFALFAVCRPLLSISYFLRTLLALYFSQTIRLTISEKLS